MPQRQLIRAVSEHLWYEVAMLRRCGHAILSTLPLGWVGHNAMVEAFALHCRNLINFFYDRPDPRYPDDVLAEHFLAKAETWHQVRPPKSELLTLAEGRANKQVSHLTYSRVGLTFDQKAWQIPTLLGEIDGLLGLFLQKADPELVVPAPPETTDDKPA